MFSVHWERPFCPIAAVLNRPSPPCPGDMRLHAEPPPVAHSIPLQDVPGAGIPRTPGVTHSTADAACIGRSVDGSNAQVHNMMSHIILAL